MNRYIVKTADGSHTVFLPDQNERYHSKHGAVAESLHVFIKNGLRHIYQQGIDNVNILEIGLGTGLNAFITFLENNKYKLNINYTAIEAYPMGINEIKTLNYVAQLNATPYQDVFDKIHRSKWETHFNLSANFNLLKQQKYFAEIDNKADFNLIYFDAFGIRVQPELWTTKIFTKMYHALIQNGILVTYSAAGVAKRNLISSGFEVEKLSGPPGKREMIRAIKK